MVRSWLHSSDPYEGFRGKARKGPDWGGSDPIFAELISRVDPSLIIEVGSWYGESAITMAKLAQCEVIAVDTWLGTMDGMNPAHPDHQWIERKHGYPTLYETFLANVIKSGVSEYVTPFPQTSVNAARVMWKKHVRADLIYIDAAHETDDVLIDLRLYSTLLAPSGIMFGHDYNHPQVREAVRQFGRPIDVRGRFYICGR